MGESIGRNIQLWIHRSPLLAGSEEEMDTRLKLLKLQGHSIQPRLLLIGDISNIKNIFVYFDEYRYEFFTILNAFDMLFKIFFVFNHQYPTESEVFYNFIQTFFYDLPTNKKFTKVASIKHEILKLKH